MCLAHYSPDYCFSPAITEKNPVNTFVNDFLPISWQTHIRFNIPHPQSAPSSPRPHLLSLRVFFKCSPKQIKAYSTYWQRAETFKDRKQKQAKQNREAKIPIQAGTDLPKSRHQCYIDQTEVSHAITQNSPLGLSQICCPGLSQMQKLWLQVV